MVESLFDSFVLVLVLYLGILVVSLIIPAPVIDGYCVDSKSKKPLRYRLAGSRTILASVLVIYLLFPGVFIRIYDNFSNCFWASNLIGLLVSLFYFVRGKQLEARGKIEFGYRAATKDSPDQPQPKQDSLAEEFKKVPALARFYFGYEWNPRHFGDRLDVKMFLYLVGAVQLQLNILAAVAGQLRDQGTTSTSLLCYTLMFSIFINEYLFFENVHLYTYDLFCERTGFKLIWGCLCFYPFFYGIGAWSLVSAKTDLLPSQCLLVFVLYLIGWSLTRGANLQKFYCKTEPSRKSLFGGLIDQEYVEGSRNRLLISGFWRLSRHINYLGEILQALALALPGYLASGSLVPFLYPIYYVGLLFPRAIEDGKICEKKYGPEIWSKYTSQVKYKIVPYLF